MPNFKQCYTMLCKLRPIQITSLPVRVVAVVEGGVVVVVVVVLSGDPVVPIPSLSTASQIAMNPGSVTDPSVRKRTVIVFPELMMELGMSEPQYLSSTEPKLI